MATLAARDLASELGVAEDKIRAFLKRYFAASLDAVHQAPLNDLQVEAVRNRFSGREASELPWLIGIGETRPRREVHGLYGGQEQGGISTPKYSRNILIFTDPVAGRKFGYDHYEGLREDGSYAYTGEGRIGDQTFDSGNAAVRDAASHGLTIRLFRTRKTLATYVGSFTTSLPTFHYETIPDVNRNPRLGIIFNLIPLNADTELLPAYGGELESSSSIFGSSPQPLLWSPPEYSDVVVEGREGAAREDRVVTRVEFQLQREFGEWMQARGDRPSRLRLRAGSALIEPDFFFESRRWIVEAKRSPARGFVREAVGQVLDYVNVAQQSGLSASPAILLPGRPERDLQSLLSKHGIVLASRSGSGGGFEFATPD